MLPAGHPFGHYRCREYLPCKINPGGVDSGLFQPTFPRWPVVPATVTEDYGRRQQYPRLMEIQTDMERRLYQNLPSGIPSLMCAFGSETDNQGGGRPLEIGVRSDASLVSDLRHVINPGFTRDELEMRNEHARRLSRLIEGRKISLVLDVGANTGQFGQSLRNEVGYHGQIVSFEPLTDAFAKLQRLTSMDSRWSCHNIALGDVSGTATINISANSYSSSLLPVSERSLRIEPSIAYIGKQDVSVRRLDELLEGISRPDDSIYLKVDTQGYEMNVLKGALGIIGRFALIQLETSFFPVYQSEALIGDAIKFLDYLGYRPVAIEPDWEDPKTGEVLQADVIFARK